MASASVASIDQANVQTGPVRGHLENTFPCIWGDRFSDFSLENSVIEAKGKEIEGLKEKVRNMITLDVDNKHDEKIGLIYTLGRLGVSYHFEKEINTLLEKMFTNLDFLNDIEEYDLYMTSLIFRVFRQNGFQISCDVFNKFKQSNSSNLKESLASDIKGMLSLYEASQMRLHGEKVLDEALAFTVTHLKVPISNTLLEKQVNRSLQQSFHKGILRIETRFYLSVYEEDHESRNEEILQFAKLDFNLVQLLHKQELSLLSKWSKNMEFLSTFPYNKHTRMRLVENYFFALSLFFEPCYSQARMMLAKYAFLITITDDIYDVYGTLEELQLFADAIDKWERDQNCIDQLPDYMKPLYKAYLETFGLFNDEMIKDGRSYSVDHAKESVKDIIRTYIQEAKWFNSGYIPTFDEYMKVASISCTVPSTVTTFLIGMDVATQEVFEWLRGRPKILQALEIIGRLSDDVAPTKFEQKVTAVHCYMKQYGVSRNEAVDQLREMVENAWKDVIEERLTQTKSVPSPVLQCFVNYSGFMDAAFKNDGYDYPELYTEFINALLVHPVPV